MATKEKSGFLRFAPDLLYEIKDSGSENTLALRNGVPLGGGGSDPCKVNAIVLDYDEDDNLVSDVTVTEFLENFVPCATYDDGAYNYYLILIIDPDEGISFIPNAYTYTSGDDVTFNIRGSYAMYTELAGILSDYKADSEHVTEDGKMIFDKTVKSFSYNE